MTKKKFFFGSVTAALMLGAFAVSPARAKTPAPKAPELSTLGEATWTPLMKDSPLPAMAPISGDPKKGAYEGYLKLPAGFESPPHSHTNEYWAVLVQGKMTHWAAEGGSEKDGKQLGVGDLVHMPAKVVHISKCYPGADCIMVTVQHGKFDFLPAKTVAKKEEKPATTVAAAPPPSATTPVTAAAPAKATAAAPAMAPAKTAAAAPAMAPAKTPASAPAAAPGAPAMAPAPAKK